MKTKWLFPHGFRLIGWLIFVLSILLSLAYTYADFRTSWSERIIRNEPSIAVSSYIDEISAVGVIIGLLLIAFSREKVEDEMISQLRLEALQWSIYVNYIILIVTIVIVYDKAFLGVMIYNMFTVLLVFIARFRWLIFGTTIIHYVHEKSTES